MMFANRAKRTPFTLPGDVYGMAAQEAGPAIDTTMGGNSIMPGDQPGIPTMTPNVKTGGGFFGEGGTGRAIAGYIGDFLAQQAGGQPVYAPQMQFNREQQRREADRAAQFRQQLDLLRWKRENPEPQQPDQFERLLSAGNFTEEEKLRLRRQKAENDANPIQGVPVTDDQGRKGIQFIRPGGGGQSGGGIPSGAADYLRKNPGTLAQFEAKYGVGSAAKILGAGGPTLPASGGFRP